MRGVDEVAHSLATGDGAAVLASRRRAMGWSQLELACRLGVSQGLVSRWERGAIVPPVRVWLCWADVLGCLVAVIEPVEGGGGAKTAPPLPALDRGYFHRPGGEA